MLFQDFFVGGERKSDGSAVHDAVGAVAPEIGRAAIPASTKTPAAAAWSRSRAKMARLHERKAEEDSAAQVRKWLDGRPPAKSAAAISASDHVAGTSVTRPISA